MIIVNSILQTAGYAYRSGSIDLRVEKDSPNNHSVVRDCDHNCKRNIFRTMARIKRLAAYSSNPLWSCSY
jgi:hypothetical protein